MSTDQLIASLAQQIATQILKRPDKKISPDEPILSSGMIDSFNLVDLSILIEEKFGVRLDDAELNANTFDTIRQLAAIIEARQ